MKKTLAYTTLSLGIFLSGCLGTIQKKEIADLVGEIPLSVAEKTSRQYIEIDSLINVGEHQAAQDSLRKYLNQNLENISKYQGMIETSEAFSDGKKEEYLNRASQEKKRIKNYLEKSSR